MNLYGSLSNGKMVDPVMMRKMAMQMQKQGRKGDTMLAHINPQEARMLKRRGGSGTINPMTGLPEYYTGGIDVDDDGNVTTVDDSGNVTGSYDDASSYDDGYYGGTGDETDPRADNDYYEYTPSEQEVVNQAIASSQSGGGGDGGGGLTPQQTGQSGVTPEPEPDPYSEEGFNRSLRESASNLPDFVGYDGEVVAPDPQDMLDAQAGIRGMQTAGRDPVTGEFTDIQQAQGVAQDTMGMIPSQISANQITASGLSPQTQGFQNQYVQSVLDPQLEAIESQRAKAMANISSGARRVGAFGGDRQALMEGQANKDAMKLAGQATNRAYSDAFTSAQNTALKSALANQAYGLQGQIASGNLGLAGMDRFTSLGDLSRGRSYQDINSLMGIGQDARGRADMQNRFNLGEFMREQDHPYKKLQAQGAIGASLPIKQEQTYYPSSGGGKGGGLF